MPTTKSLRRLFGAIALLLFGATTAFAQVLVVNVSNPSAVTLTGTGTFASANYNGGTTAAWPVRLAGFFTSAQSNIDVTATSTTLKTTGADHTIGYALLRVGATGATTLDFRKDGGNSQENFSTGSAAFTGTATFNLSANSAALPASGASGNILAADGSTVIGTYSVVTSAIPEPSTYAVIMGPIVLGFAFFRRRRKSFA